MNISRRYVRRGRFGIRRTTVLRTQIRWADDGRDVERDALRKVRQDLCLDVESGVDSEAFYGDAATPQDLIFRYQTTLRRLAKL